MLVKIAYPCSKQNISNALSDTIVRIPDYANSFNVGFHIVNTTKQLINFFILKKKWKWYAHITTKVGNNNWKFGNIPNNNIKNPRRDNHLHIKWKVTHKNSSCVIIYSSTLPLQLLTRWACPVNTDMMSFDLHQRT